MKVERVKESCSFIYPFFSLNNLTVSYPIFLFNEFAEFRIICNKPFILFEGRVEKWKCIGALCSWCIEISDFVLSVSYQMAQNDTKGCISSFKTKTVCNFSIWLDIPRDCITLHLHTFTRAVTLSRCARWHHCVATWVGILAVFYLE